MHNKGSVQMLQEENKSYSFTNFGDLLCIKYKEHQENVLCIYFSEAIHFGSDSQEKKNPTPYKLHSMLTKLKTIFIYK